MTLPTLSDAAWAATLPVHIREQYEERAAIMEFDGGLARAVAQSRARAECEQVMRDEIAETKP